MVRAVLTPLIAWAWMTSSAAMKPMLSSQDGGEQPRGPVEAELAAGLDRLRHAELRSLARVQGDEQRADQRADRDRDDGPPEGEADGHAHAAEHDVEDVDVGARPENELVPGFPVPCGGGDELDVAVLDVPAQLFILHHGLIHDLNYPSEKELLTSSCSTAWTFGPLRPLITALSRSTQDRERSHPDPLSMRPGTRVRTAAFLEAQVGVPEVANAGFLRSVYIASRCGRRQVAGRGSIYRSVSS